MTYHIGRITLLCTCLAFILPLPAAASDGLFQWTSTNVQLLRGHSYEFGPKQRTIMTFEHANGWKYGDFYTFADFEFRDGGRDNYYAEFSPRISLGKVLGQDISYGLFKDVLLTSTYEKGQNGIKRYLIGGAIDLNIPGFKYFKTNFYNRNNPDRESTWQTTVSWKRPFEISNTKFVIEGFADFYGEEGGSTTQSQLIVPRFLVDVGSITGHQEGSLFAGVEWQYWHNKFGVRGTTENVPQLQLKWVF